MDYNSQLVKSTEEAVKSIDNMISLYTGMIVGYPSDPHKHQYEYKKEKLQTIRTELNRITPKGSGVPFKDYNALDDYPHVYANE